MKEELNTRFSIAAKAQDFMGSLCLAHVLMQYADQHGGRINDNGIESEATYEIAGVFSAVVSMPTAAEARKFRTAAAEIAQQRQSIWPEVKLSLS
jgi:hypothetical protein